MKQEKIHRRKDNRGVGIIEIILILVILIALILIFRKSIVNITSDAMKQISTDGGEIVNTFDADFGTK